MPDNSGRLFFENAWVAPKTHKAFVKCWICFGMRYALAGFDKEVATSAPSLLNIKKIITKDDLGDGSI